MVKSNLAGVFAFGLCILCAGAVTAGHNNHSESVCDASGLIGSAYAACHVYCDSLDCDVQDDPRQRAACDRAFDRFVDLTGNAPPCEISCPCASTWLAAEFLPADIGSSECFVDLGDAGGLSDLRVEGEPNEDGFAPLAAAGFDIFDDGETGFGRFGCFAERYVDDSFEPTEDSGVFEVTTTFRDEDPGLVQQRIDMFNSCRTVFEKIVEEIGVECSVVDNRTE